MTIVVTAPQPNGEQKSAAGAFVRAYELPLAVHGELANLLAIREASLAAVVRCVALEEAAMLHENIGNDCDADRGKYAVCPSCGCGAMGAVIEYRDAIRRLKW